MNDIRLEELLPLLRGSIYDHNDEQGEAVLCLESETWTWVKLNLSSGILDDLGDYAVTDIDADEGKLRLWIKTEEFNVPVRRKANGNTDT